jgi:cytochrome bd-type quinol oxidase subunit 2
MRDKAMADPTSDATRARGADRSTALVSFAAIGSVLAASSCCLPILPFVAAAGLAGSSAFLSAARPYLMGASVLLVAYGFYQAWRAKKCRRQANILTSLLLWLSAIFVFVSILLPQVMANAVADLLRH